MRQGHKEKAEALTRRIGILIAKRNSTMIKSKGGKVTSRDMWAAVRKLSNRATPSDQSVAGIDAGSLNEHYAGISHDANYVAPPRKATANAKDELVTEFQVFQLLDKLKPTATGLDELPAWFLRIGAPVFAKYIAMLFQKSIREGVVPAQWKQAYIRPIAKVSSPSVPADFRPISITPVLVEPWRNWWLEILYTRRLPLRHSRYRLRINTPSVHTDLRLRRSYPCFIKSLPC